MEILCFFRGNLNSDLKDNLNLKCFMQLVPGSGSRSDESFNQSGFENVPIRGELPVCT